MLVVGVQAVATGVDDHDVALVRRPRRVGAAKVCAVGGDRLAGGRACEQAQEDAGIRGGRDQLLDAHAGDVQRRQGGAEIGVALVGADDDRAGLGDGEVDAGQPGLGREEALAQVGACGAGQAQRIVLTLGRAEMLMEQFADLAALEMDGRHHDV